MSVHACFFVRYFFTLCPFTTGMHAQNSLKFDVFSLNVRGIRDQTKRRRMFSYLKDQKAKLYFLQETYSEQGDETIWKNEWGGDMFFPMAPAIVKGSAFFCILQ